MQTDLSPHADLTTRETEILALLANGHSNQDIASTLTIEVGTVKNHVHRILKKLGLLNRNEAAMYYRAWALTKAPPQI